MRTTVTSSWSSIDDPVSHGDGCSCVCPDDISSSLSSIDDPESDGCVCPDDLRHMKTQVAKIAI
ncbi:hypothetical protein QJS10_CPA10g00704 [Acorus calamus]|uniref:Uncharacterized protein n=1 Tax=Acorus calamus TaxID=4465 RepID=A0AAV9DY97_ACOCL|nr:hypothetical protein QJS10_CPA10g00704 [Acorus calamus]